MTAFAFDEGKVKTETETIRRMQGLVEFIRMFKPLQERITEWYVRSNVTLPLSCFIPGEPDICLECYTNKCELVVTAPDRMTVATVDMGTASVSYNQNIDKRLAERVRDFVESANSDPVGTLVEVIRRLYTFFLAMIRGVGCDECYDMIRLLEEKYIDHTGEAPVVDTDEVDRLAKLYKSLFELRDIANEMRRELAKDRDINGWPMHISFSVALPVRCGETEAYVMLSGTTYKPSIIDGVPSLDIAFDVNLGELTTLYFSHNIGHTDFLNILPSCFKCVDRYERAPKIVASMIRAVPKLVKALVKGLPRPDRRFGKPVAVVLERYKRIVPGKDVEEVKVGVSGEYMKNVINSVDKLLGKRYVLLNNIDALKDVKINMRFTDKDNLEEYASIQIVHSTGEHGDEVSTKVSIEEHMMRKNGVEISSELKETPKGVVHQVSKEVEMDLDIAFGAPPWAAELFVRGLTIALHPGALISYVDGLRKEFCQEFVTQVSSQ